MIPSPIKRNDFITLDKDSKQIGRILAVSYPNALDDLLEKYSLDEGDVIHLLICGLAAVGRVEDAQDAYWYLHDMARSGKGKSMRESSEHDETKMERKLRMIESKLGKLSEGLLSQEREDSTNKQKSEKAALERAAKVVEIMKALDKEHGYTFGVRNTKTEDAAKMLITGEASIPFDQDDRKVLRALYNGLNKFCATVRKHTFVLKKDCFYDEEKFNELIDYLS